MVTYLRKGGSNPNRVENGVRQETFKNISLTMNFSCVDFIEQSHHNKCIENNSKVLSRFGAHFCVAPGGNI